jgi:hypothetical protein
LVVEVHRGQLLMLLHEHVSIASKTNRPKLSARFASEPIAWYFDRSFTPSGYSTFSLARLLKSSRPLLRSSA